MTTGERIKNLRVARHMSQEELAEKVGLKKAAISKYENGLVVNIKRDIIGKLADALETAPTYLMGMRDEMPTNAIPVTRFAPVLGTVRCGEPLLAEENIEGYMPIPYSNDGQDYFILHAVGDSMDLAGISEGDLLIVRKQPEVESSEIAIVCVNGDEATAKYYGLHGNMAILTPKSSNPENQTQVYDIKKTPVRVIGRVVKIMKDC